jgi:hypothetical protein
MLPKAYLKLHALPPPSERFQSFSPSTVILSSAEGRSRGVFCFCNIPKMHHFKNTSLNIGFAELPSKHGPHRSFASENVFPKLSPRKRTVELSIERRHKKTRFHSSSLFSLLILILSTRALPLVALFQRSPVAAVRRV